MIMLMTTITLFNAGIQSPAPESENINIENQGVTLNTTVYAKADAETVILLHGGPGVPNEMKEVANLLSEQYQVIFFEQRGTGNSRCSDCSYTMNDYISDIDAIAAFFDLNEFHLYGHSWGGLYAQIYAEEHPSRIKSLFLCSPSSGTNENWKVTEMEVMNYNKRACSNNEWMKMGWNSLLGRLGNDKAYRKLFRQVYKNYHSSFIKQETSKEELEKIFSDPINKTRKEIIKYKPLLPMVDPVFPICITYGESDIYGDSKNKLIDRYPTAELHMIEKCGHIPWLHNPAAFNKILDRFYGL